MQTTTVIFWSRSARCKMAFLRKCAHVFSERTLVGAGRRPDGNTPQHRPPSQAAPDEHKLRSLLLHRCMYTLVRQSALGVWQFTVLKIMLEGLVGQGLKGTAGHVGVPGHVGAVHTPTNQ